MKIKFPKIFLRRTVADMDVTFKLDPSRFEKQYEKAQWMLDNVVMAHMSAYMPHTTGTFINRTKAMSASIAGSGYVYAAAPPYGRFLYYGKTMVSMSGSTWAKRGEKKVLVSQYNGKTNAQEDLHLMRGQQRIEPEWFEVAKRRHLKNWVWLMKKEAGGG